MSQTSTEKSGIHETHGNRLPKVETWNLRSNGEVDEVEVLRDEGTVTEVCLEAGEVW